MNDFLNNEINIEDEAIYLKNLRTGSSTIRKIMFKGKILSFKNDKVNIQRIYNKDGFSLEEIDTVFPHDVVVLKGDK